MTSDEGLAIDKFCVLIYVALKRNVTFILAATVHCVMCAFALQRMICRVKSELGG